MLTCPQCHQPIDTAAPYEHGGRIGLLGEITRPSHLGACETMPVFALVTRAYTIKESK